MCKQKIAVKKLRENAVLPTKGSASAAGADLRACLDEGVSSVSVAPGQTVAFPTGLAFEIPAGYVGLVFARSGISCRRGLAPANKVGVIDSDYRGEVTVALHNHGETVQQVEAGERIAQMVIVPVPDVTYEERDSLSDTARGEGGFGSTGKL